MYIPWTLWKSQPQTVRTPSDSVTFSSGHRSSGWKQESLVFTGLCFREDLIPDMITSKFFNLNSPRSVSGDSSEGLPGAYPRKTLLGSWGPNSETPAKRVHLWHSPLAAVGMPWSFRALSCGNKRDHRTGSAPGAASQAAGGEILELF